MGGWFCPIYYQSQALTCPKSPTVKGIHGRHPLIGKILHMYLRFIFKLMHYHNVYLNGFIILCYYINWHYFQLCVTSGIYSGSSGSLSSLNYALHIDNTIIFLVHPFFLISPLIYSWILPSFSNRKVLIFKHNSRLLIRFSTLFVANENELETKNS